MPTLPTRADRVAALYKIARLASWEPPYEEMYLALFGAVRAGLSAQECHQAVWVRAHQLAAFASLRVSYTTPLSVEPTPLDYAIDRARRIWALVTADRIADTWVSLASEAGLENV